MERKKERLLYVIIENRIFADIVKLQNIYLIKMHKHNDQEFMKELCCIAEVGWWRADYAARLFYCSEFLQKLLVLEEGEALPFDDFYNFIREDYRTVVIEEISATVRVNQFNQAYPIVNRNGEEIWVRTRVAKSVKQDDGNIIYYGVTKVVENPDADALKAELDHIKEQVMKQKTMSGSLSHFIREDDPDQGIMKIQSDLLRLFRAQRTYIFEYDEMYRYASCLYETPVEGVSPEKDNWQQIPVDSRSYFSEHILNGHALTINSTAEPPVGAEELCKQLSESGVQSFIVVPLMVGDKVWGYGGIDLVEHTMVWSKEDAAWLSSVGNMVSICLQLTRAKDTALRERKALNKSEDLFHNIFAKIPVGVEIYDKDGYIIDINNRGMEMFGIRREEILGLNIFDNPHVTEEIGRKLRTTDDLDIRMDYEFDVANRYCATYHTGILDLTVRVRRLYDRQGNFNGWIMIFIDNTEQTNAIRKIQHFENLFQLVSDFAKVGYAKLNFVNRQGYAIKQWYKNMGEEEGTPLEEVVGVYSKIHPDDREEFLKFFPEALAGRKNNYRNEVRVLRPGETDKWNWVHVHIVVTELKPEQGIMEIVGINYDITELKETQDKLIQAKEKAEEADRLKSAFVANMSHEIRTPLNAIVGFSSLLMETEDVLERQEYTKIVAENNDLLLQLISDILDLSKIEAGMLDFIQEQIEVTGLCEDIVRTFQLKVPNDVRLYFETEHASHYIYSDRNRLHQVISNFVNNAVKFTTRGSIRVSYELQDNWIRFSVTDTGIGIAPENLLNIFERFIKLNGFVQGTGLGLPICKNIVEQLGGVIGADSELDKGSCFWFKLPMNAEICDSLMLK